MIPTMTPKSPRALPKISTIRIFTNIDSSCAWAMAHPLPVIPTQIPSSNRQHGRYDVTHSVEEQATIYKTMACFALIRII